MAKFTFVKPRHVIDRSGPPRLPADDSLQAAANTGKLNPSAAIIVCLNSVTLVNYCDSKSQTKLCSTSYKHS